MLHFAGFPLGVNGRVAASCWRVPWQCSEGVPPPPSATSTPSNIFHPRVLNWEASASQPSPLHLAPSLITLIFLIRCSDFSVVYFSLVLYLVLPLRFSLSCLFVLRVLSFVFLNVQLDVDIILVWFQNEPPQHSLAMLRLRCPVSIWMFLPFSVLCLAYFFSLWPLFDFTSCVSINPHCLASIFWFESLSKFSPVFIITYSTILTI